MAAVAYFFLTLLLAASWKRSGPGLWLIVASVAMTLWACVNAFSFYLPSIAQIFGSLSETLRTAGWVMFLAALLRVFWREYGRPDYERQSKFLIAGGILFLIGLDIMVALQNLNIIPRTGLLLQIVLLSRMAAAIGCVFMVDNFYRNTAARNRWGIQLLCLGLGSIFLYDFFFYADAVLSAQFSRTFFEARGAINALIVPLIALSAARNPSWRLDVSVSRGVVIHTASLVGSGIYLVVMGAAGYYLGDLGGRWSTIIQYSFWFGALLLLAVIMFSGQFRARMRVIINKHFFSYRYDYRAEWLRFLNTVSSSDMALGLQGRVIQALADIVDSPGGALWLKEDTGYFTRAASWNTQNKANGTLASDDPFLRFIGAKAWIVDLEEFKTVPELYEGCDVPEWFLSERSIWLIVPLLHYRDELIGFVVLEEPRVPRSLNWEDRDILKTVARQIASYVAEQGSEKELAEARQFEEFNKKFAFIMHDIKNLASQLSLMVKNADRHAGNPDFQRDMILTVRESVEKMQGLLTRLNRLRETEVTSTHVKMELTGFVKGLVDKHPDRKLGLTIVDHTSSLIVKADPAQLETVVSHLCQNAREAAGPEGQVHITVGVEYGWAVTSVSDNGPGMSEEFVREELFKPFRTTKEDGYGIGAFESRQIVRTFGGRLDVETVLGEGTVMKIRLPLVGDANETAL